jgi:hypothetical protein
LLNDGNIIILNIRPNETVVSTVNVSVTDQNGCTDFSDDGSAVATIYISATSSSCSADPNTCYQIDSGGCILSACDGDDDVISTFTCSANFKYYANPTDDFSDNNPWRDYNWISRLQVFDGANYTASTSPGVELKTASALSVDEDEINYNLGLAMEAGDDTEDKNSTTTVINAGNTPIDVDIKGIDMTGVPSGTILVSRQEYDLSNFAWGSGTYTLSTSDNPVDTITPKATTTIDVEDEVYWGIGVPFSADAATYEGENTFTVRLDDDNW